MLLLKKDTKKTVQEINDVKTKRQIWDKGQESLEGALKEALGGPLERVSP